MKSTNQVFRTVEEELEYKLGRLDEFLQEEDTNAEFHNYCDIFSNPGLARRIKQIRDVPQSGSRTYSGRGHLYESFLFRPLLTELYNKYNVDDNTGELLSNNKVVGYFARKKTFWEHIVKNGLNIDISSITFRPEPDFAFLVKEEPKIIEAKCQEHTDSFNRSVLSCPFFKWYYEDKLGKKVTFIVVLSEEYSSCNDFEFAKQYLEECGCVVWEETNKLSLSLFGL